MKKFIILLIAICCSAGAGWAQNNGKLPTINTSSKTTKGKMPTINTSSTNSSATPAAKPVQTKETPSAVKQNTQTTVAQPTNKQTTAKQPTVSQPTEKQPTAKTAVPITDSKKNETKQKSDVKPQTVTSPVKETPKLEDTRHERPL